MTGRRRLTCGAAAVIAAGVTLALRGGVGEGLAQTTRDVVELLASAAIAGAVILPGRVWPAARGWLRPLVGGLLTAPAALLLALAPDVLRVALASGPLDQVVLWLLIGTVYALIIAGPVFAATALALHAGLRAAR